MNLRELRRRRGMTQEQLAKAIGTSQDIVSKYERSPSMIRVMSLERICGVLQARAVVESGHKVEFQAIDQ